MFRTKFGRMLLGAALILAGLKVRQIDSLGPGLVAASCNAKEALCPVYRFGFETLGVGGIWSIFVVTGMFYLIIFDWLAGFLEDMRKQMLETVDKLHPLTISYIQNHKFGRDELTSIVKSIFANSAGAYEKEGESLGTFVADLLLYLRPGQTWKRNHITKITVRKPVDTRVCTHCGSHGGFDSSFLGGLESWRTCSG